MTYYEDIQYSEHSNHGTDTNFDTLRGESYCNLLTQTHVSDTFMALSMPLHMQISSVWDMGLNLLLYLHIVFGLCMYFDYFAHHVDRSHALLFVLVGPVYGLIIRKF